MLRPKLLLEVLVIVRPESFLFLCHQLCLNGNNELSSRPTKLDPHDLVLEAAIKAGANAVIKIKDNLNEWDAKAGDGDCGSTMLKGATAIIEDLKTHYPLNDMQKQ